MLDPLSIHIPFPSHPSLPPQPSRKLLQRIGSSNDFLLEIDNSSLELFTICQRKAENKLIHGREAARSESALQFGRLFHECEELRLLKGSSDTTYEQQRKLVHTHFLHHPVPPDDHRSEGRMLEVLKKYNAHYASDGWPQRLLLHEGEKVVERPFKIPLTSIFLNQEVPYTSIQLTEQSGNDPLYIDSIHAVWTGRIDAIISDGDMLFVVDHKTSSTGGKEFEDYFRLASQTVGYTWAAQKILQRQVHGLIINAVIIRPPAKTARAAADRETFLRQPYFYRPDRMEEWEESTKHIVSDFVASLSRGYFPMSGPKSFKSPCCYCDYHENCQLPPNLRASDLASDLYRNVTWTPIVPTN